MGGIFISCKNTASPDFIPLSQGEKHLEDELLYNIAAGNGFMMSSAGVFLFFLDIPGCFVAEYSTT